jgi:hypothetical protein
LIRIKTLIDAKIRSKKKTKKIQEMDKEKEKKEVWVEEKEFYKNNWKFISRKADFLKSKMVMMLIAHPTL